MENYQKAFVGEGLIRTLVALTMAVPFMCTAQEDTYESVRLEAEAWASELLPRVNELVKNAQKDKKLSPWIKAKLESSPSWPKAVRNPGVMAPLIEAKFLTEPAPRKTFIDILILKSTLSGFANKLDGGIEVDINSILRVSHLCVGELDEGEMDRLNVIDLYLLLIEARSDNIVDNDLQRSFTNIANGIEDSVPYLIDIFVNGVDALPKKGLDLSNTYLTLSKEVQLYPLEIDLAKLLELVASRPPTPGRTEADRKMFEGVEWSLSFMEKYLRTRELLIEVERGDRPRSDTNVSRRNEAR